MDEKINFPTECYSGGSGETGECPHCVLASRLSAAQDLLDAVSDEMMSFTTDWHAPEIVDAYRALNALADEDGRIDRV